MHVCTLPTNPDPGQLYVLFFTEGRQWIEAMFAFFHISCSSFPVFICRGNAQCTAHTSVAFIDFLFSAIFFPWISSQLVCLFVLRLLATISLTHLHDTYRFRAQSNWSNTCLISIWGVYAYHCVDDYIILNLNGPLCAAWEWFEVKFKIRNHGTD